MADLRRAVHRVLNVRELLGAGARVEDIRQVAPCPDMKTADFLACQDSPAEDLAMYEERLAAVETKAAEPTRYRAELAERIALLRAGRPEADFGELLRQADTGSAA